MPLRAGKMGGSAVHLPTAQYTCRTKGVQADDARAIKVRNAHEMVLWWDAQVPDRLPRDAGQAA
ncbi:hypothetical protein LK07_09235 [Streptomyces pluripotens]|uniref:Uncharacterized protein n=1 Tax=Streptomyces pluripotens TaxID=1355015 RepID=A0A221NWA6_9ACTN|nr:hypothetical protein LK07_09235 [Streptomyces pluripotens]